MNWSYENVNHKELDGPYEDADPFPYDLTQEEVIPEHGTLMTKKGSYVIYNIYEDAFLLDMKSKEVYHMGDYYGDPEQALIDKQGAFAVVVGSDHLGIFDMVNKKLELRDIDIPEWIVSLNQEGRKIEVICEEGSRYLFEI